MTGGGGKRVRLAVKNAFQEDVYGDTARIPERFRLNGRGTPIAEGQVCKVIVGKNSRHLILRGDSGSSSPTIRLDEVSRIALGVQTDQELDVWMRPVGLLGQFAWAWKATNPAYRITSRLAVLSLMLGVLGLLLGIMSLKR